MIENKHFCIGLNKTGTTSIRRAFKDLGLEVGSQKTGVSLVRDYRQGNWDPIISFCRTAQAFQDIPFSLPGTFLHLDAAFPRSKFILTVRDTPDQWYESLVGFHSKLIGGGKVPTRADLQKAAAQWPWAAELFGLLPEDDPYSREILLGYYTSHNDSVLSHFSARQDDLLVLNLAEPNAYEKFCSFMGVANPTDGAFPWENRTSDEKIRL